MIYLDNAATTKPYEEILTEALTYVNEHYYNPSSVYLPAFEVKKVLQAKKQQLAKLLGASYDEIIFTSGATESNNLFLQGVVTSNKKEEYIFSLGEHSSVYEVANFIKGKGYTVHFAKLLKTGQVDLEHLLSLVNENTRLVSVMHVSNETGAVNDIKLITSAVKQKNKNTLVHSDGVQAFCKLSVNVKNLGVDAYTISGHKIHAVKGVGALFIKSGVFVRATIFGGGQEDNRRSGTENVLGIMSLVNSAQKMHENRELNYENALSLKTEFKKQLASLEGVVVHVEDNISSPYILSLSILGIKSEILVHMLAKYGVLISTGSSCSSNSKYSGNRTLEAMGKTKEEVMGSVRISFSQFNTLDEVKLASELFIKLVNELRSKIA